VGNLDVGGGLQRPVAHRQRQAVGKERGLAAAALEEDHSEARLIKSGKKVAGARDTAKGIGDVVNCLGGGASPPGTLEVVVLADPDDGKGEGV
jgi:hypothetical protein